MITSYSYDGANQLSYDYSPTLRSTHSYGANGNTTLTNAGGSVTTYCWDIENRMTRAELPSGGRTTATYDGDGKRRSYADSAGLRDFLWDGENIAREMDGAGATTAAYSYAPSGYGALLSQRRSGATSFHHYDALGSTTQLTDASQSPIDSYLYRAFGEPTVLSGSSPNPFRWVGRLGYYRQADTGDYWVRARIYPPAMGRWVSRDPLVLYAWYAYAGGNPVLLSDPSGMWGVAVHRDKTTQWAKSLRFGAGPSAAIAAADVQVDSENWSGYRRAYHERSVTGDFRRTIAAEHLTAAKAAARRGDCKAVWEDLGHGLHALQDISAHGDYPVHWGEWLDDPTKDIHGNPDPGQSRVYQAFQETKAYLKSALADPSIKCCLEIAKHQAAERRCQCVKSKKP